MKMKLAFIALCALTFSSSIFAYCVYNQTAYQDIFVLDWSGQPGHMGLKRISNNSYVCCAGNSRGCDGASISADITASMTNESNTKHINGCTPSKHSDLYITGGNTAPLRCKVIG